MRVGSDAIMLENLIYYARSWWYTVKSIPKASDKELTAILEQQKVLTKQTIEFGLKSIPLLILLILIFTLGFVVPMLIDWYINKR